MSRGERAALLGEVRGLGRAGGVGDHWLEEKFTTIALTFLDKANPITKGMEDWTTIKEELYNNASGRLLETATPVARGKQVVKGKDGKETVNDCVVVWTNAYNGKTRVFATTLGHNNQTVADPRYMDLVTRGLLWAADKLGEDGKPKPGYGAAK